MTGKPRKRHYVTDTEAGIRTITQIRNLPSHQLTDEEFAKEFFDRFQAKALIMVYTEDGEVWQSFGRLKAGENPFKWYRNLGERLDKLFDSSSLKEI